MQLNNRMRYALSDLARDAQIEARERCAWLDPEEGQIVRRADGSAIVLPAPGGMASYRLAPYSDGPWDDEPVSWSQSEAMRDAGDAIGRRMATARGRVWSGPDLEASGGLRIVRSTGGQRPGAGWTVMLRRDVALCWCPDLEQAVITASIIAERWPAMEARMRAEDEAASARPMSATEIRVWAHEVGDPRRQAALARYAEMLDAIEGGEA